MCTNFNDGNRWLHSILQPVEFRRSKGLVTDVSWLTNTTANHLKSQMLENCKANNRRPPICMGMWHLVVPPFGLSVLTDPPFCYPKNSRFPSPPKSSVPPRDNNDRSLMAEEFYDFWGWINHFLKARDTGAFNVLSDIYGNKRLKKTTEQLFGVSEDGVC